MKYLEQDKKGTIQVPYDKGILDHSKHNGHFNKYKESLNRLILLVILRYLHCNNIPRKRNIKM